MRSYMALLAQMTPTATETAGVRFVHAADLHDNKTKHTTLITMEVKILVTANITFDDDTPDFEPGDPGEERMRDSAREAVNNALQLVRDEIGFFHDMDSITSIDIVSCEVQQQAIAAAVHAIQKINP